MGELYPEGLAGRTLGSSSSSGSPARAGTCTGTDASGEEEKPAACPKANCNFTWAVETWIHALSPSQTLNPLCPEGNSGARMSAAFFLLLS